MRKSLSLLVALLAVALMACGPPAPAEEPESEGPTQEELEQQRAEAEAPYHAAVQKFNDAIWELEPDLLHKALTEETYELFMERAELEAELRDIEEEIDDKAFLEQQQDYKIVYAIKSIDLETGHAAVQGMIEGEVQWESEINFVEEYGDLKIDHAPVLKKAVADLEDAIEAKKEREKEQAEIKTKVETLLADHNTALADENPEMFEATLSAETAELSVEYLRLLPKKEGGKKKANMKKFVKFKAARIEKVELKEIDFDNMTAVLTFHPIQPKKGKKDEEAPAPYDKTISLVEEGGRLLIDCSAQLKLKIKELTEAAAEEEEGEGKKKKKKKKKDE
jgi:hypothetical protein